jgi:superfamily II DNA or RNA helicase
MRPKAAETGPVTTRTKKSSDLSLRDLLSRLSPVRAARLLGKGGNQLLLRGGKWDVSIDDQVTLRHDRFRLRLPEAVVDIALDARARHRLRCTCSGCSGPCEHVGAALSLILEEKLTLGLAKAPPDPMPVEGLSEEALIEQALAERAERARVEKMRFVSVDPSTPWTDYMVTSAGSGKTYRVALRGESRGDSYCSCPDFRKNTLGTCKHILQGLDKVRRRFPVAARSKPYRQRDIAVHLRCGRDVELRALLPAIRDSEVKRLVQPLRNRAITDVHDLLRRVQRLEAVGRAVTIYPDAEEYIQARLFEDRMRAMVRAIRADPSRHALRTSLLEVELLPYQLDGIAFAAGAGRAILADDMGLGKTIQGIGVAELLAREAGIERVLIVCPASLKAQWRAEIGRFSTRDCQLVLGPAAARESQYQAGAFFTVCNYEQVLRDVDAIERVAWGLIVLDEGQRIKNWEAKTSRVIKALRSRFALALTGTPLENRLDELYSLVEFIDDRRLGPLFRFHNRHRVVDERGRVLGYKNLDELREKLAPVLLRRTRAEVMAELPPRTTELIRVPPTQEQADMHRGWMQTVQTIVNKRYLTEMDLLRLQKALVMCRMVANSTYLVDKCTHFSSKLEKLDEVLGELVAEGGRKMVVFSEWTTMLDLVEKLLQREGLRFVRLDGSVPQRRRQRLVHEFQNDPSCAAFLATNAGSTGLNLQRANTVLNLDLPWNPAVLEQRIGRAHRMGQRNPVHVLLFVTEGTLEENLLTTLSAKNQLALAALDVESDVDEIAMEGGIEELKSRLEQLLGAEPEAPVDRSEEARRREETEILVRRERIGDAAGQLVSSAFALLGELLPEAAPGEASPAVVQNDRGRPQLTVTLPDRESLDHLSKTLARLLAAGVAERHD